MYKSATQRLLQLSYTARFITLFILIQIIHQQFIKKLSRYIKIPQGIVQAGF